MLKALISSMVMGFGAFSSFSSIAATAAAAVPELCRLLYGCNISTKRLYVSSVQEEEEEEETAAVVAGSGGGGGGVTDERFETQIHYRYKRKKARGKQV